MSHPFPSSEKDIGCANGVEHEIHLKQEQPFKEPCHRMPPGQLEEILYAIHDLLDAGIATESKSPYVSPVVLVKKKHYTLRVYVDSGKLNAKAVRDSNLIPRIVSTL